MSEIAPDTPTYPVLPVTLQGRFVLLEPITEDHRAGLAALHADAGEKISEIPRFPGPLTITSMQLSQR